MTDLSALETAKEAVEAALADALTLPQVPEPLRSAMEYSVLNGGKRLRGFLVLEGGRLMGLDAHTMMPAAVAIECLHAYSLVHDDMPAMDDDDLRRGKPTTHKAYDEATAILVGDALQSLAFEHASMIDAPAERVLALTLRLAQAAGALGMVGGQMRDINAETAPDSDIAGIQSMKTGALFEWSAEAGAIIAGKDPAPMRAYAQGLGLAFQIQDDLLDVEGDAKTVGKAVGKDGVAGKATYVSQLGVEGARAKAADCIDKALEAIAPFGAQADTLAALARYVIRRTH